MTEKSTDNEKSPPAEISNPSPLETGDKKSYLNSFLEENSHLLTYLTIDNSGISPNRKSFPSYRDSVHRQNLKKLRNLKESKQSSFLTLPELPPLSKPSFMEHEIAYLYHKNKFVIWKFKDYQQKVNSNFENYVSSLIKLFEYIIPNGQNEVIDVNFKDLTLFLHKIPEKMKKLRIFYLNSVQDFNKEVKKSVKTTFELRKEFLEILQQTKFMVDPSLNFFCPTSFQEEIEAIIFSPNFGVTDILYEIIDKENFDKLTPPELVQKIIKLNNSIIQIHKLRKEDNITLIITFLFRMIFNEVYPMIKLFYLEEFNFDLLLKLKDFTLKDIGIPLEYCPSEFSNEKYLNGSPRNAFRNDPNYSLACLQIEFISFFTNPLDILHHICASLHEIEKAAMIYKMKNARKRKNKNKKNSEQNDQKSVSKSNEESDSSQSFNDEINLPPENTAETPLHVEADLTEKAGIDGALKGVDIDENDVLIIDGNFKRQCIEDGLSEFLFPFDVTFALFTSSILASDVPEFMRIAAFADRYSPTFGLCAGFEFALAKLKTVSIYLQNLAQQMIEKEKKTDGGSNKKKLTPANSQNQNDKDVKCD